MKSVKLFCLLAFGAILFNACSDDDDDEKVTYTNTIKSELATCAVVGCHVEGFQAGSLANYEDVKAYATNGKENLLGSLRHEEGFAKMPAGGDQWSTSRVEQLENWINDGMPE